MVEEGRRFDMFDTKMNGAELVKGIQGRILAKKLQSLCCLGYLCMCPHVIASMP